MENIGKKIKSIRESKGLSQEALASASKVNIRTIQRIESGKNKPHGNTLQLICEALGIQPNEIMKFHVKEDHTTMMWLYFSICSFAVFPMGNIIIPLIIWLNNKERVHQMDKTGKNVVYNQIIFSIFYYILFGICAYTMITHMVILKPHSWIYIFILCPMINLLFAIYAGIMAKKGKYILYPFFKEKIIRSILK